MPTLTTLPVGLVRDLEAALARPGAGLVRIVLRHGGGPPRVVDTRGGLAAVPVPCPKCAEPMGAVDGSAVLLACPACGHRCTHGSRRLVRRLGRVLPGGACRS